MINFNRTGKRLAVMTAAVLAATAFLMPVSAASTGITKEETVYIVTDSAGGLDDIVVSDHLKNSMEADTINDSTDLTDIENVNGDETFKKGRGDQIIWDANGRDIFYDGKTHKELPVTMDITYKLDGEKIEGDKLQGKSGDFEITIDFKNDAKATVNGREITVPFIAMTGFVADDDNFTELDIDNGKVIDDGNKKIVVGLAAPGVTDALKIDTDKYDLDLKDSIKITGKVKKFNIQDMMTVVTNSVFEDIDTGDIKLDFDDEVNALEKGARSLVEGSETLYDGIDMLYESAPELSNGVTALRDGAERLNRGTRKAKEGAVALDNGANKLKSDLTSQMKDMAEGTAQLRDGTKSVLDGMEQTKEGVDTIKTGLDGNNTAENPGVIPVLTQVSAGLKAASDTLRQKAAQMEEAEAAAGALADYMNAVAPIVDANKDKLNALGFGPLVENTPQAQYAANQLKSGLSGSADQLRAAADQLYKDGDVNSAGYAVSKTSQGLKDASDALGTISSAMGTYDSEKGLNQDTIIGGQTVIYNGLSTMNSQISGAIGEKGSLSLGLNSLTSGTSSLRSGEVALAEGAEDLSSGMRELEKGSEDLVDGVGKLDMGALALKKGMKRFYREGIKELVGLYRTDLKGTVDGLKDMMDAGSEYKTFTKLPDDMDGDVKFIYKTRIY